VDWDDAASEYHRRTFDADCHLIALPIEWQRELAALWRVNTDVNNGAYLQFLENWGRESYVYAHQSFKKIGAHAMADIICRCQALIDEHFPVAGECDDYRLQLMRGVRISRDGTETVCNGSALPESVRRRIHELSYEFMDYPDDVADLAQNYYGPLIDGDSSLRTDQSD
jgi:Domain of unknown function (DUF4375)